LPFVARVRRSGVLLYRRRSGRRQLVIWAFDAVSAPPGQGHHALLIAFEIAGSCTGVCEGPEAPWVRVRRLRRCRLDFAKQRRSDQKKPWDWQMHRSLPEPDCSFRRSIILSQKPATRPCLAPSTRAPGRRLSTLGTHQGVRRCGAAAPGGLGRPSMAAPTCPAPFRPSSSSSISRRPVSSLPNPTFPTRRKKCRPRRGSRRQARLVR